MSTIDRLRDISVWLRLLQKEALDIEEASFYLRISEGRIRHLAAERIIPHYKSQGRLYFSKKELDEWRLRDRVPSTDELSTSVLLERLINN